VTLKKRHISYFYCSPRFCHDRQFFESALQLPLAISNDPFIPNGVGWPMSQHNNTDNLFVIDKSVTLHNALVFQVGPRSVFSNGKCSFSHMACKSMLCINVNV
jgi:hypothetical protein